MIQPGSGKSLSSTQRDGNYTNLMLKSIYFFEPDISVIVMCVIVAAGSVHVFGIRRGNVKQKREREWHCAVNSLKCFNKNHLCFQGEDKKKHSGRNLHL